MDEKYEEYLSKIEPNCETLKFKKDCHTSKLRYEFHACLVKISSSKFHMLFESYESILAILACRFFIA